MFFEFFKQRIKDQISIGDEIAVFAESNDYMESGRYSIMSLGMDDYNQITVTAMGMGHVEGNFFMFPLDCPDE